MDRPNTPPRWRSNPWWTVAALFAVTFAVYWPSLNGGVVWDDDAHVTRPGLQSLGGLWRIWTDLHATQQYYPLLHSAFWVEHTLWGDATFGYHLTNILLHATSASLLVLVLKRLDVPGARLAGLIFAVHPVCVESVAWISEQKNTLSLVFYLLSTLAYLRFDRMRGQPAAARAYGLASALFVLALLTKSVTSTLPAALLVILWWQRGRISWRQDVKPLLPWFVLAVSSGALTSWIERTIGGAQGGEFDLTLVQRCLLAGRNLWFYLGKIVWPTNLVLIYPRWNVRSESAGWILYFAAAILVTVALWLMRSRSRGPLAAWLLFVGTLFPALGFFNVYPFIFSFVADHFQYHAMLGIIAAVAAGAAGLLERVSQAAQATGWAVVATLVTGLALLSNGNCGNFTDQHALFEATLEQNPGCWLAHDSLGLWYKDRGDAVRAMEHFQEAIRLRNDYPQAHNNLGLSYEDRGEMDKAIAEFREALRFNKDLVEAHNNLGSALGEQPGHMDEAAAEFQEAVRLQPEYAGAHDNLGSVLLKMPGRLNDAIAQYREAVRLDPGAADAHAHLGYALSGLPDQANEAIGQYEESIRLNPGDGQVRNNLGLALIAQGRSSEAVSQFEEALRLMPNFAEIRLNLAIALLNIPGQRNEAARQLDAYLQVRPANEMTQQILGQIQATPP
jgi:tetratricopeptide (TPR) repeat protein